MKIIHTADLHLDSKLDFLPMEKASIRREEILRSFERLCEFAKQNDVSVVIISGDLFDSHRVTKKALEIVVGAISMAKDIDFLYLSGNHDEVVDQNFFENFPSNFKIFPKGFTSFRYNNVVIAGYCDKAGFSKSSYDQISFDVCDYNLLCLHGQIADYKTRQTSEIISIPLLKDKNIDYLALGHYHTHSFGKIDDRGGYVYSGCLDGRGFDELESKGFILIDTDKKSFDFVEFSSRICYELEFDVAQFDSWYMARNEIISIISSQYKHSSLLKLVLKGEISADFNVDVIELENRLNEILFFVKIEDKTTLKLSAEDYLNDKTVRGEFLKLVWESDLSPEQKKMVISCGLNAIKGEDVL